MNNPPDINSFIRHYFRCWPIGINFWNNRCKTSCFWCSKWLQEVLKTFFVSKIRVKTSKLVVEVGDKMCWWQLWLFWSPTSSIFFYKVITKSVVTFAYILTFSLSPFFWPWEQNRIMFESTKTRYLDQSCDSLWNVWCHQNISKTWNWKLFADQLAMKTQTFARFAWYFVLNTLFKHDFRFLSFLSKKITFDHRCKHTLNEVYSEPPIFLVIRYCYISHLIFIYSWVNLK